MMNRRELLGLVFTGVAWPAALPVNNNYRSWQRRYRANAVILFCGVQIFSKSGVGSGYAVAEEVRRGGLTDISLQFAGGSWPEKAHGVNRLGFIQETVTERANREVADANYFGFMTSSAEKNFEQAKRSFSELGDKPVPYTATQGASPGGRFRCALYRMFFPSSITWAESPSLIRQVQETVERTVPETQDSAGSATPNTFLNSVRQALLDPAPKTSSSLVYNGKVYRLTAEKQEEPNQLIRLNGSLTESATGQRTPFRLWYEKSGASYLPVRIEYRAKPFLKLVFEEDANIQQPAITRFLNKENL